VSLTDGDVQLPLQINHLPRAQGFWPPAAAKS
jgi:hypothetical protein